MAEIRHLENR